MTPTFGATDDGDVFEDVHLTHGQCLGMRFDTAREMRLGINPVFGGLRGGRRFLMDAG